MQLPTLKAELFTVLWDYIARDQHTRYTSRLNNTSFLLDSWVTCNVVIAAVLFCFVLFSIYVVDYQFLNVCNDFFYSAVETRWVLGLSP